MRVRLLSLAVLPLLAVLVGCTGDPEARKREFVQQGDEFFEQGKYADAIVRYRNAVREDEKFGEARAKLATAFEARGDYRNALAQAVRAADLMPDDVEAQIRAARLLVIARQFEDARTRAMAALAKDAKNVDALIVLGNALAGLKDLDGAIEQVEQ